MLTDVGRIRKTNEDKVLYVAPEVGASEEKIGFLALVADGMGGHAAGEVASEMAAELIRNLVYSSRERPPQALSNAFHMANRAIFEQSQNDPELRGMGTTCTAILIRDETLYLAHIGDSRAYLWRNDDFRQLSDDQTLHAKLVRDGLMTAEEALTAPGGNFILQALGARESIEPTISEHGLKLESGDRLLLCSDGLYSFVKDAEIAKLIAAEAPAEACQHLVDAANGAGGADNISVGIFQILNTPPPERREQASTKPILVSEADRV
jgi:protein phosphatase